MKNTTITIHTSKQYEKYCKTFVYLGVSSKLKKMTDKEFWKIIDSSKNMSEHDFEKQKSVLKEILLSKYSPHDIVLFKYFFDIYKINLYRWDLFVAYRLISNEYDEDYFLTFREWLVGQGQEFYYNLISNPDGSLVELPSQIILLLSTSTKDLSYVAIEAYIDLTGDNQVHSCIHLKDLPNEDWADQSFNETERLPLLIKKYKTGI